ncbi:MULTISPECIES: SagB/ThcOx family dehydrogenase [Auritidibacter]|uniref:SagB/ThcOx family dehydrogenase n=1 Tax=Auritidibacter ignavus TaxID=678932 RepID=A0AAJ6APM3_9MICC|nr:MULTISPECIES: SagB/ThcOx family dehydrogenase [Auritidibacter]PXA78999.1 hypothetical protein DCC26_06295 [Auritidibacter sp. NML120779]AXR73954.1 SagB/ThcOx family dehydrogenase [Auritidibacter sp. NML130574]WGH84466.1 SagB/ThcOx family dehydrogenase [Auritidibacter ignavus]WGH93790.1 SagB/ThcOx family dehydrogenase [Auritidibacter ignavus]WHS27393.1 SagB/ThcOx family dehydrogenase [Auritidibacter ignavus]
MPEFVDSSNLEEIVYGQHDPIASDIAEDFFEASKITPVTLAVDLPGVSRLMSSPELREMSQRAGRLYSHRPTINLPQAEELAHGLSDTITSRCSPEAFGSAPINLQQIATALHHAQGIIGTTTGHPRRTAPSAGALYPLDLFIAPIQGVDGLNNDIYHYSPFTHTLAEIGPIDVAQLRRALGETAASESAAAVVIVICTFWRSRFKYGYRGVRFSLIEAGHIAQNLALSTHAQGLASRAIGGFFDDELAQLIPGVNGVDDAPVYTVLIGSPPASS